LFLKIDQMDVIEEHTLISEILTDQIKIGDPVDLVYAPTQEFNEDGLQIFSLPTFEPSDEQIEIYAKGINEEEIPAPSSVINVQGYLSEIKINDLRTRYIIQVEEYDIVLGAYKSKLPSIIGKIVDSVGGGILGAKVSLGPFSSLTDFQGNYILPGMSQGTYLLEVSRDGYIPYSENVGIFTSFTVEKTVTLFPVNPPQPSIIGPEEVSLFPTEEKTITFLVRNDGGFTSDISHLTVSVSNNLEIIDFRSSHSFDIVNYPIGSIIWNNEYEEMLSAYQMVEFYGDFPYNEDVLIDIIVKAKSEVNNFDWIRYRATMFVYGSMWDNQKWQFPSGGGIDQQGYYVNEIKINKIENGNILKISNFGTYFCDNPNVRIIYPSESMNKPLGCLSAMVSDWIASGFIVTKLSSCLEGLDIEAEFVDQITGKCLGTSSCGIVSFGGPVVNPVVKYAESDTSPWSDRAPIKFDFENGFCRFKHRDGSIIPGAQLHQSVVSLDQDMFVIEVFEDGDGRYIMLCYGFGWKGTYAAGKYFDTEVFPNLENNPYNWIIVKWEDTNGNGFVNIPGGGDTYTIIEYE